MMIPKADVICPHCGHVQSEPCEVVSTFCRGCGEHIALGSRNPAPFPPAPTGPRSRTRAVHCYRCGKDHGVSFFAKSTICTACGAAIELCDLDFASNASRPVDIRGRLSVRSGACLNHARIICTDARIDGTVIGTLLCENRLELRGSGRLSFRAVAGSVFIGRGVDVVVSAPIEAGQFDLRGRLVGNILCGGLIAIRRGGRLEGDIRAPAILIERGGIWRGGGLIEPSIAERYPAKNVFEPQESGTA